MSVPKAGIRALSRERQVVVNGALERADAGAEGGESPAQIAAPWTAATHPMSCSPEGLQAAQRVPNRARSTIALFQPG
jgi:hypothetical protein